MAEHTAALKASPSGERYFATLREWLAANRVALDPDDFLGRPDACVVLIPRVMQPNADRVGPRYVFAGPCIDEARMGRWTPAIGAGVQLAPERLDGEGLREAVAAASARGGRARELRDDVRRSGGPAIAADAVERFVESELDLHSKSS
jgi:hypothetical protein